MTSVAKKSFIDNIDFIKLGRNLDLAFIQPLLELYVGIMTKRVPLYLCMAASCLLQMSFLFGLDYFIFNCLNLTPLYPRGMYQIPYRLVVVIGPFMAWGGFQVILRMKLIKQLTEIFMNAGLKSATGKLPAFIFDKPIDEFTRRMRVSKNGQSLQGFENAKDALESGLHVFVDEISERRRQGTVDIIYSHTQLEELFDIQNFDDLYKDAFLIGQGRSKVLYGKLSETPHLLVAGQTGMGKSTFLRQFITSLYLKNSNYSFDLIDLKGGLEFQLFENLPRVEVQSEVEPSIDILKTLATKTIQDRSALFKANGCKDIEAFLKIPRKEIVFPKGIKPDIKMDRHIVVVDEAFDLFMAGAHADTKAVQKSRKFASKIAAQGRAVGIHIVIATQRPDRFAVDPQTKANLTGKICFSVPNIASSMTMVDSRRAHDLPNIKGRALWQNSSNLSEIQTPFYSEEQAIAALNPYYVIPKKDTETEQTVESDKQNEERYYKK